MLSHNDLLHIRVIHRLRVSFSLAGKGLLKICKHLSSVWKRKVSNVGLKLLIFTYFYQQLFVLELTDLSHSYSSKDPAWILSPTLIPTIPRKQHTPFLSTGSSGAAVAESTGWLILDEPHPREHSHLSTAPGCHTANSLFSMLAFIQHMDRYEKEKECSHCLHFVFILPASCFKERHRFPQIN